MYAGSACTRSSKPSSMATASTCSNMRALSRWTGSPWPRWNVRRIGAGPCIGITMSLLGLLLTRRERWTSSQRPWAAADLVIFGGRPDSMVGLPLLNLTNMNHRSHKFMMWNCRALLAENHKLRRKKLAALRSACSGVATCLLQEARCCEGYLDALARRIAPELFVGFSAGLHHSHGGCFTLHRKSALVPNASCSFESIVPGRALLSCISVLLFVS